MTRKLHARFYGCKVLIWISFFMGIAFVMPAQTVPVGMPFFEDALRRAQLMGRLDTNISFMIRPVDPVRAGGIDNPFALDTNLFPLDSNSYAKSTDHIFKLHYTYSPDTSTQKSSIGGKLVQRANGVLRGVSLEKNTAGTKSDFRLTLLPIYTHTRFNRHHPYGWSDGAMVPAAGLQQYISGGVYLKAGPLEAQLRPEYVWAQNREFQNPPFRPQRIHMPERMGQETYTRGYLGQSFVKLHMGPLAVGMSNENIWWGPGRKNAIIMSNNAPGFQHFTLHTNKPITGRYGTLEGQIVAGRLRRSGFVYPQRYTAGEWPPIAGDVVPDSIHGDAHYGFFNGMSFVYQPKWTPGLFLGASRVVQVVGEPDGIRDYFNIIYLESRGEKAGNIEEDGMLRNQIISVFARYLFKESNAEIYFEVGREDNWWDFEDFMTRLNYSTAYLTGFRKIYVMPGKDHWLQLDAEYTKIQAPFANLVRAGTQGYSFYSHGSQMGWTHRGQVLGAGIGPGSNMHTLGVTYGKGFNTYGIHLERVAYHEDMMYTQIDYLKIGDGTNPFLIDASKHFVDWGFLLSHHTSYNKLMVGYNIHILRTYNFQWNYDPYGAQGPFRFPGINKWLLNAEVSLVYRF